MPTTPLFGHLLESALLELFIDETQSFHPTTSQSYQNVNTEMLSNGGLTFNGQCHGYNIQIHYDITSI
jgi:hypothetical protein